MSFLLSKSTSPTAAQVALAWNLRNSASIAGTASLTPRTCLPYDWMLLWSLIPHINSKSSEITKSATVGPALLAARLIQQLSHPPDDRVQQERLPQESVDS